jgi:hypothetical protein
VVTALGMPPEIVALVLVNDAQQSKGYILQAELKAILSDNDAAEALRFLNQAVWAQVQAVRRKELRGLEPSRSFSPRQAASTFRSGGE